MPRVNVLVQAVIQFFIFKQKSAAQFIFSSALFRD